MSTRLIYILVASLVLIAGAFYLYDNHQRQAQAPTVASSELATSPVSQNSSATQSGKTPTPSAVTKNVNDSAVVKPTGSDEPKVSAPHYSDESDIDGNDVAVHEVTYDGTSFSPARLTVKSGDIVMFKNASDKSFWPASNPHPSHTDYPGFDAKQPISPGENFQFKFTRVGSWGYHNHLTPEIGGTIIVTQ